MIAPDGLVTEHRLTKSKKAIPLAMVEDAGSSSVYQIFCFIVPTVLLRLTKKGCSNLLMILLPS